MNKLLVITVLVALLALSAESFRMPRQAEEEQGTWAKISTAVKSKYEDAVNTASDYLESIRGLKLEEKAKNLGAEIHEIARTYAGITMDQIYYTVFPQQN